MPNDTLIVVHGGIPFEVTPFRGGDGSGVVAKQQQQQQQQQQKQKHRQRQRSDGSGTLRHEQNATTLPLLPLPSRLPPSPGLLRGYAAAALDARLRDFTVNALMCDPVSGTVLDWVGGRSDLSSRASAAAAPRPGARENGDDGDDDGSDRLKEDPLRCLRAVRFAAGSGSPSPRRLRKPSKNWPRSAAQKKESPRNGSGRSWSSCLTTSREARGLCGGMRLAEELEVLQVILPEALHEEEERERRTEERRRQQTPPSAASLGLPGRPPRCHGSS